MMIYNWVSIGLGYDLLYDGTKPLPEPMLLYYHLVPMHSSEGIIVDGLEIYQSN